MIFRILLLSIAIAPGPLVAQPIITSLEPLALRPGVSNSMVIHGQNFRPPVRVWTSFGGHVAIKSIDATRMECDIQLPEGVRCGPVGLCIASDDGISDLQQLYVDDLISIADRGDNHTFESAQSIDYNSAVDGFGNGSLNDFYRISLKQGQIVSIEVISQRMGSTFDPILRLRDRKGREIISIDDGPVDADVRLKWIVPEDAEYSIEVGDNRYAPGGRYRLRVGDFPLTHHPFPLIVRARQPTPLVLVESDGRSFEVHATDHAFPAMPHTDFVFSARRPVGSSSSWWPVAVRQGLVHVEGMTIHGSDAVAPLPVPVSISGLLAQPQESDSYWLQGSAGQTVRISSKTRSLGSAALLSMRLFDQSGTKVAEAAMNDLDEWSLDHTFAQSAAYRLVVEELASRGGSEFGYVIDIVSGGGFAIALKPDPNGRDRGIIEPEHGVFPIDLLIQRMGFDGAIELSLDRPDSGLAIYNPTIPEKSTEARIFIVPAKNWSERSLSAIRLVAKSSLDGSRQTSASTLGFRRLKTPHQPFPPAWLDGLITIGSGPPTEPFLAFDKTESVLSRESTEIKLSIPFKRLVAEFQGPITVLPSNLPQGWKLATAFEQDQMLATLTRPSDDPCLAAEWGFDAIGEFKGRWRRVRVQVPIRWIESEPSIGSVASMTVFPQRVELNDGQARQQLIVLERISDGSPIDGSHRTEWTSANPSVAQVRHGIVYPIGNGDTEIHGRLGNQFASIPVVVRNFEGDRPVQFENEVLVALSKQGCNSGACHGSPSGKGGLRLSLRAFDPKLDEMTLIREEYGRRLNVLDPEKSLLLRKPLMRIAHGGGLQLRQSDAAYGILKQWIAQGARPDPSNVSRCIQLELFPSGKQVLERSAQRQQLAVTARFADGSSRDVTHLVSYESSNTSVATVDSQGLVQCRDRGEAVILVRFLEHIESLPMMFIERNPEFQWNGPPPHNEIDTLVDDKLKQLQIQASELSSDEEFLRRVHLDLIGILPTVDETQAFLADQDSNKRIRLVDDLLERPEYAKFWALKWGDLLKLTSKNLGDEGAHKFYRWLENSIRDDVPYPDFARALICGSGSTFANPPANFYRTASDMNDSVETISQVFLGARLQCAKCHNHPFERWTQDHYYGMGAFFHRVQRRKTQRPGEWFVWYAGQGEVIQPRTGKVVQPWLPGVGYVELTSSEDRREAFVDWLVQPDNPYFAKMEANRTWSHLFAKGIVDPIDDFRDSNPPTNPPLLNALAKDFVASGFRRKHLIRKIVASRTYQSSHRSNSSNLNDRLYFSHQQPRLLTAEQLLDAINQVTGTEQSFGGLPSATKATHLPAPDFVKVDFLKVFGQSERSTVCACERSEESNLGMAIELFNGPLIQEKLRQSNNRFRKALEAGEAVEDVVKELYLAALCRAPSDDELRVAVDHCRDRGDSIAGLEDVSWALLNLDEFLFQH